MKRFVACLLLLVMGFPMWSQSPGSNPTEVKEKKLGNEKRIQSS